MEPTSGELAPLDAFGFLVQSHAQKYENHAAWPRNDWLTESMTVVVSTVVWRTSSLTGCDCLSSKFVSATSGSPTCWEDQIKVGFFEASFQRNCGRTTSWTSKPICSRPKYEIAALTLLPKTGLALTSSAAFLQERNAVPD